MLIGLQRIKSQMTVEIVNRKVVGISAQIKELRYFDMSRALGQRDPGSLYSIDNQSTDLKNLSLSPKHISDCN